MLGHLVAGAVLPAMILSSVGLSGSAAATVDRVGSPDQSGQPRAVDPGGCNRHWTEPQMEFVKDKREWDGADHMGTLHWAFMIDGCRTWWYGRAGSGDTRNRKGCKVQGPIPDSGRGRHRFTYKDNPGANPLTRGLLWQVERIDCRHIERGLYRWGIFVHSSGDGGEDWKDTAYWKFETDGCIKVRPHSLNTLRRWQKLDQDRYGDHRAHGTIKVRQLW